MARNHRSKGVSRARRRFTVSTSAKQYCLKCCQVSKQPEFYQNTSLQLEEETCALFVPDVDPGKRGEVLVPTTGECCSLSSRRANPPP